jgi:hypothetical protein
MSTRFEIHIDGLPEKKSALCRYSTGAKPASKLASGSFCRLEEGCDISLYHDGVTYRPRRNPDREMPAVVTDVINLMVNQVKDTEAVYYVSYRLTYANDKLIRSVKEYSLTVGDKARTDGELNVLKCGNTIVGVKHSPDFEYISFRYPMYDREDHPDAEGMIAALAAFGLLLPTRLDVQKLPAYSVELSHGNGEAMYWKDEATLNSGKPGVLLDHRRYESYNGGETCDALRRCVIADASKRPECIIGDTVAFKEVNCGGQVQEVVYYARD